MAAEASEWAQNPLGKCSFVYQPQLQHSTMHSGMALTCLQPKYPRGFGQHVLPEAYGFVETRFLPKRPFAYLLGELCWQDGRAA